MNSRVHQFFLTLKQSAKLMGAGLATIGVVGAVLLLRISCNPQKELRLVQLTLLGFALCEAMGLLAIMMAFLILYS